MTDGPFFQLQSCRVSYGPVEALRGVTLAVNEGEVACLIGANGAGKSTTLMTISGILKPQSGKKFFQGEDITALPAEKVVRRGIVQVPEGRRIFPRMTVTENLEMGDFARARGLMARPRLLLLDEPSLGLAPQYVEAIFETIGRVNREGITVFLVEQNAAMALEVSSRGYVMETGTIVLADTAAALRANDAVRKAYLGEA